MLSTSFFRTIRFDVSYTNRRKVISAIQRKNTSTFYIQRLIHGFFGRIISVMRNIKLAITLLALQAVSFFIPFWLVIWLRTDCSGTFSWQCSTNTNPLVIPYLAFAILPPILAKLFFDRLGKQFSWKKMVLAHICIAILVVLVTWFADPMNRPTGG